MLLLLVMLALVATTLWATLKVLGKSSSMRRWLARGYLTVPCNASAPVFIKFDDPRVRHGLVVDCTHPHALQLTHHKGQRSVPEDVRDDCMSSTDYIMNAIRCQHDILKGLQHVSSNHFDIDSFISVFCVLNPEFAKKHEALLREVARIGDFRELQLTPTADQSEDSLSLRALKICCWLNSVERQRFYRPFGGEEKYETCKMEYFLQHFESFLEDVEREKDAWAAEFDRVLTGWRQLNEAPSSIQKFPEIGLVVISTPEPVHYYALFAPSRGFDLVLTLYDANRYELEVKYTTYVDITTRGVLPRIELLTLPEVLNALEEKARQQVLTADLGETPKLHDAVWGSQRITDSGPLLRLDRDARKLGKEERYGHPYERPIHSSCIDPDTFQAVVRSYFEYAYTCNGTVKPKIRWTWDELHQYNRDLRWDPWREATLTKY